MAKKTAKESVKTPVAAKKREPMSPEAIARARKIIGHSLAGIAFCALCAGTFAVANNYVDRVARTELPPTVVMKDRPAWMSDSLAEQILSSVRPVTPFSASDHQMLVDRAHILASNPWIKSVHAVRRAYENEPGDRIEIDCEYRAPVALVRWQDAYWYVDTEGVRLPERLNAEQVAQLLQPGRTTSFRVIDGVGKAPAAPGQPWPGGDVQAGIELIALLADKPYADQIVKVDVSNFNGRLNKNESHLNLVTRFNTEIRWGQAPSSKAFFVEQRVDRKLGYLQDAKAKTGRIDMNRAWIDLRFDSPTVPNGGRASIGQ